MIYTREYTQKMFIRLLSGEVYMMEKDTSHEEMCSILSTQIPDWNEPDRIVLTRLEDGVIGAFYHVQERLLIYFDTIDTQVYVKWIDSDSERCKFTKQMAEQPYRRFYVDVASFCSLLCLDTLMWELDHVLDFLTIDCSRDRFEVYMNTSTPKFVVIPNEYDIFVEVFIEHCLPTCRRIGMDDDDMMVIYKPHHKILYSQWLGNQLSRGYAHNFLMSGQWLSLLDRFIEVGRASEERIVQMMYQLVKSFIYCVDSPHCLKVVKDGLDMFRTSARFRHRPKKYRQWLHKSLDLFDQDEPIIYTTYRRRQTIDFILNEWRVWRNDVWRKK